MGTKVCKNCKTALSETHFPKTEKGVGRHSFCGFCIASLTFGQVVKYHHYFNPNFKPTKGFNPFVEEE